MDPSSLHCRHQIWKISRNLGSQLSYKPCHYTNDEALQQPKLDPTSMSYIYKMFDNLHMHLMGGWIHHHSIVTTRFGKLAEILGHCRATNCTITQMMRLYKSPKWIPHSCHTYTRCLSIFVCNGWAYRSIITLSLLQVKQRQQISRNPGSLLSYKP